MNKKIINIIFILITIFFIMMPSIVLASNPIDDPEAYRPGRISGGESIATKAGIIYSTINVIGIVVAVIVIIIIGIKYMVGSVSERAEYKKTMIPYLVGAFMLASLTTIIRIFAGIITNMANKI